VESLPALEKKTVAEALEEIKAHPRSSLHYLFENFAAPDEAFRAVVEYLLRRRGGADVIDNLNAVIFDAEKDDLAKVRANDILAALDSAVDPDVFAMSVADAGPLKDRLPARALERLAAGDTADALARARALPPASRHILMHEAAEKHGAKAVAFLAALAQDGPDNAAAAVSAVGEEMLAEGVSLLGDLLPSADRTLQKTIKRVLFEMRKAGIQVPREEPVAEEVRRPAEEGREPTDGDLRLYRALMSDPSPNGLVVVVVARQRPNGRITVFSVLISLWKRGIDRAAFRMDMSKSSFERFVSAQSSERTKLRQVSLEECRRMVARGLRISQELGAPLPSDFGVGKSLLGHLEAELAAFPNPFLCSSCGAPLDEAAVAKIRSLAAYDNMPAETRCAKCRPGA